MASTTFKKRDRNRFRKVYPFTRVRPSNTYCSDDVVVMEVGKVSFSDSSTISHKFSEVFTSAPIITAISVDTGSGDANVNIFVSSITLLGVTFNSSAEFTGDVHFHAIQVGE